MAVNGYFQLVNIQGGFGVKCVPPKDGGNAIQINELMEYLGKRGITGDAAMIKRAVHGADCGAWARQLSAGTGEL